MTRYLEGKAILVTGAGGGIGRDSSLVFAARGAKLLVSDIDAASGEVTAEAVRAAGGTAVFQRASLADEQEVAQLVDRAIAEFGRLDGAFNNAGIEAHRKRVADLELAEWQKVIDIDLTATFLCVKHEVRVMLGHGGGSIVNTASSLGQVAIPNAVEYVAAKHGVIGLTRAAAADYSADGIRVNAVLPGIIRTPMFERVANEQGFREHLAASKARHPIGRFGESAEIGEACAWLLSDGASFVTGAAIAVDGGYLAT